MFDYYLIVEYEDGTFKILEDTPKALREYAAGVGETTRLVRRRRLG